MLYCVIMHPSNLAVNRCSLPRKMLYQFSLVTECREYFMLKILTIQEENRAIPTLVGNHVFIRKVFVAQ